MKRRDFVSLAGRISALIAGARFRPVEAAPAAASEEARRVALQAVVDEIIPAGERVPSASGAGALAYFERRRSADPAFAKDLESCLDALDGICREASGAAFARAGPEPRIAALRTLETRLAPLFAALRDATYEAYYTNPHVQRLIGYDFRTGATPTAALPEFDESILARVRRMPAFYRRLE